MRRICRGLPVGIVGTAGALVSSLVFSLLPLDAVAESREMSIRPFKLSVVPEVRTAYISLGKVYEDRPMQLTSIRLGYDTDIIGTLGIRNWDVSSLTDRRSEVHRHCLYHTEFGPTWEYDWQIAENWRLKNDLTLSWTLYRGFEDSSADKTYRWLQLDQSVENPYAVPFWRMRKCVDPIDFFYFKLGLRKKIFFFDSFYVMPQVVTEGGSSGNNWRRLGKNVHGGDYPPGPASVTFHLEVGWALGSNVTAYAYVEQYDVILQDGRDTLDTSSAPEAHKDLTLGCVGVRFGF